jgi:hypothetical protein
MNRVDLQFAVADAIEKARATVKSKKGLRAAMRVGAYRVGNRIFASFDGESAVEIKGNETVALPNEDFNRYVRPEYGLTASYEFNGVPVESLNTLLASFREVAAS